MTINNKNTYPSLFHLTEKALYNSIRKCPGFDYIGVSFYLMDSVVLGLTPFTALSDTALGVYEAFYAIYEGAPVRQITRIIQKKLIASPLQHLIYAVTRVFFIVFSDPSLSKNYSSKLFFKWISPEGFSIFHLDPALGATVEAALDSWMEEASENERSSYKKAKEQIMEFCYSGNNILDFSDLQLHSLPDIFHLKPFPSKLKILDLRNNQLVTLPESFGNLQELIMLNLDGNRLTTLPESFGNLQELEDLSLNGNRLTALPESLGNLHALRYLNLDYNPTLSGIPNSILQLPSTCFIDLEGCNLSANVLERLIEARQVDSYSGPTISFSIADRRTFIEERSIQQSLNDLYAIINKQPAAFTNLQEIRALRPWLSRLADTADYRAKGVLQKVFAEKIIGYLHKANDDKDFCTAFSEIIANASETCGDRVTLSILHLSMAHQLATIDLKDRKKLADFLIKGPWTLEMLEKFARDKVNRLRFFDEIEVYLGYPIKLKEALEIPIDVEEMLYFSCSALTDKDLQKAKGFVLSQRKNEALCFEFLIHHDTWKEALKSKYPIEFNKAEENRITIFLENGYEAAEKEFNRSLVDLTKKTLS